MWFTITKMVVLVVNSYWRYQCGTWTGTGRLCGLLSQRCECLLWTGTGGTSVVRGPVLVGYVVYCHKGGIACCGQVLEVPVWYVDRYW